MEITNSSSHNISISQVPCSSICRTCIQTQTTIKRSCCRIESFSKRSKNLCFSCKKSRSSWATMIETRLLGPRQTLSRSKSLSLARTRTWFTIITKKMTFCWVRSQAVNRVDLANGSRTLRPERKATQVLTTTIAKSWRSTMKEKLTKRLVSACKSKAFQCRVLTKKAPIINKFRWKSN